MSSDPLKTLKSPFSLAIEGSETNGNVGEVCG